MKPTDQNRDELEEKIARSDARLEELEQEIDEIGGPAAESLRARLEALKVEEQALKRNYEEARQEGACGRMKKVGTLLKHIEREESSVGHEADFLHQSPPSSVTLAVETGVKVFSAGRDKLRAIIGDHHPFGSSVFVNRTHDTLSEHYGLEEKHQG